jgi:hypothetical protein
VSQSSRSAFVGVAIIGAVFLLATVIIRVIHDPRATKRSLVNALRAMETPPYELRTGILSHNGTRVKEMSGNRLATIGDDGARIEINLLVNERDGSEPRVAICVDYYGSANLDVRFADPIVFTADGETFEWGAAGPSEDVRFVLSTGKRVMCNASPGALYAMLGSLRVRVNVRGHGGTLDREIDGRALYGLRHFVSEHLTAPNELLRSRVAERLSAR